MVFLELIADTPPLSLIGPDPTGELRRPEAALWESTALIVLQSVYVLVDGIDTGKVHNSLVTNLMRSGSFNFTYK